MTETNRRTVSKSSQSGSYTTAALGTRSIGASLGASVVGASAGYGIMSTCDKLLYMWELLKGTELGALQYCKGANVSCIEADDSDSGSFAIACDDGQLQVYMPSTKANQEER